MSNSQKSSNTKVTSKPVKPMTALQGYLDDMLTVATTSAAVEEVSTKTVEETVIEEASTSTVVETSAVVETASETLPETTVETLIESPVVEPDVSVTTPVLENTKPVVETLTPPAESASVVETVIETTAAEAKVDTPAAIPDEQATQLSRRAVSEEGEELPYPQWAASGFECLLFYVGGIKLAVPLVLLGGIHRIEQELTPLFGQPDWFLGLYTRTMMDGQQNIRVVHTSKWVMPEKQCPEVDPLNHYVISLGDSEWGLLSHQLSDSIRLTADQVKWRTTAGKRPWLAGTVIDHMCAILDVDRLVDLLDQNSNRLS